MWLLSPVPQSASDPQVSHKHFPFPELINRVWKGGGGRKEEEKEAAREDRSVKKTQWMNRGERQRERERWREVERKYSIAIWLLLQVWTKYVQVYSRRRGKESKLWVAVCSGPSLIILPHPLQTHESCDTHTHNLIYTKCTKCRWKVISFTWMSTSYFKN